MGCGVSGLIPGDLVTYKVTGWIVDPVGAWGGPIVSSSYLGDSDDVNRQCTFTMDARTFSWTCQVV